MTENLSKSLKATGMLTTLLVFSLFIHEAFSYSIGVQEPFFLTINLFLAIALPVAVIINIFFMLQGYVGKLRNKAKKSK